MISIKKISNSGEASRYYSEGDYYTGKNEEKEKVDSNWSGKGAEELGYAGEVGKGQFKDILDGRLPNGVQLGRKEKDGEINHTKGWDLTLSAPKSISIVALVGQDKRLIEAHKKAVRSALQYAEKNLIQTRVTENGKTHYETTGNGIFASFVHKTSRALDPQLHSHNILANATMSKDGKWRSINSSFIYDNSMEIGNVYKMELESLVKELGYETTRTRHGNVEIKDIPKELIETFSKRRQQIEKARDEYGYTTAKGMDKAAVRTRSSKEHASENSLINRWLDESKGFSHIIQDIIAKSKNNSINRHKDLSDKDIVQKAIKNLSERNSSFKAIDLINEIHRWSNGQLKVKNIGKLIESSVKDKTLFKGAVQGKTFYTTKEQYQREKSNLRTVGSMKGKVTPFSSKDFADSVVKEAGLNEGQTEAVKMALLTKDMFIGTQGYAGTGKTYMLQTYKKAMDGLGKEVLGFAPQHKAVKILSEESGIKSDTVARFVTDVINGKGDKYAKADAFVIDEASMLNTKDVNVITKFAKENKVKVMFLGDRLQYEAVEAGKPFEQLVNGGMETATMKEIMRQKESPNLLQSVISLIHSNPTRSFNYIKDNIHEIYNKSERNEEIVNRYVKMNETDRENHLLLIPDNKTRREVNQQIQSKLLESKQIGDKNAPVNTLSNLGLTELEKKHTHFYQKGQVVIFNKDYKGLGINKNETFDVVGTKNKSVIIQREGGKKIEWKPEKTASRNVEVYEKEEKNFHLGDMLRANRSNKDEDIKTGLEGTVKEINEDSKTIKIEDAKGKIRTIAFDESVNWDLKYATTVYSSQGATVKDVTLLLDSKKINLTNLKTAYVGISRSKSDISLFVDSKEQVEKAISKRLGRSVSSYEALGKDEKKEMDYGGKSIGEKLSEKIREFFGRNHEKDFGMER